MPPEHNGKRGRPRLKGERLDIHNQQQFKFNKIDEYFMVTRKVITNLFKNTIVYATVTTPDLNKAKSYRLFISTIMPEQLELMIPVLVSNSEKNISREHIVPLLSYNAIQIPMAIEVVLYEQKTFWSFGKYMLRSVTGIENHVNLINICYTCVRFCPGKINI